MASMRVLVRAAQNLERASRDRPERPSTRPSHRERARGAQRGGGGATNDDKRCRRAVSRPWRRRPTRWRWRRRYGGREAAAAAAAAEEGGREAQQSARGQRQPRRAGMPQQKKPFTPAPQHDVHFASRKSSSFAGNRSSYALRHGHCNELRRPRGVRRARGSHQTLSGHLGQPLVVAALRIRRGRGAPHATAEFSRSPKNHARATRPPSNSPTTRRRSSAATSSACRARDAEGVDPPADEGTSRKPLRFVELLNYDKKRRPFQHTVNPAPVRAGDGEVVLFRTTSSAKAAGAANDANTGPWRRRPRRRPPRPRAPRRRLDEPRLRRLAESGDLRAADDARYDSVESLLEDTVAAQGRLELADTSLHLDVDAAAVAALVNASPPQLWCRARSRRLTRVLRRHKRGGAARRRVGQRGGCRSALGASDIVGRTLAHPGARHRPPPSSSSCRARASVLCDNVRLVNYGQAPVRPQADDGGRDAYGAPEFLKATSTDVQRLGPLVALQKTLDDLTLQ